MPPAAPAKSKRLRWPLLVVGAVLLVGTWVFREPLRQQIRNRAILADDAPTPEAVGEMIEGAADPRAALLAAWNSGKIVHREAAIHSLSRVIATSQPLRADLESLLLSAALDPDMNVREMAFGILRERNHRGLGALAAEQLRDCDEEVRALGLNYLRYVAPAIGVRLVIPVLEDGDPFIVTLSLKLLENWSGEDFGVKLSETGSFENPDSGIKEYRAGSREKAKAGAERARTWWVSHQGDFPAARPETPAAALLARRPVPAGDFELRTLDGRKVRLSDYRGKVVLINFWTTWCTACLREMPELIALQNQHLSQLVILGISLDCVPDEHGHAAIAEPKPGEHFGREARAEELKRIREKVTRAVKDRGINYPILLDEQNDAGGRFNGGELPTTVLVDAEGQVRRRFVGGRSLPVFEAMIAEAGKPLQPVAR